MTTWRVFPSTNGPAAATTLTGNYMAGVMFQVTSPSLWFYGYWVWCCNTGQATSPVNAALWNASSSSGGVLVPNTSAVSGTLTPGAWNFIPLATPIPIAIGTPYCTAVAINGAFPKTASQFGAGQPFVNGITQGPLIAYSDSGSGGSNPAPYTLHQMPFTTATGDPTAAMPTVNDLNDNLWVDVQISDQPPAGFNGPYRLWPNKLDGSPTTQLDANQPFNLSHQVNLSQPCKIGNAWFLSLPTAASLPTEVGIWNIGTQQLVTAQASPTWLTPGGAAAAAGGGWCKCAMPSVVLPAGQYKVSVYNANGATLPGWSPRDFGYWLTGPGQNGISWGPITAPPQSQAATAYVFQSNAGSTPPWTDGHTQEPSQGTFAHDSFIYPYLAVDFNISVGAPAGAIAEWFGIDLEFTPVSAGYSLPVMELVMPLWAGSIRYPAARAT